METNCILDQQDQRTRKYWLYSLWALLGLDWLGLLECSNGEQLTVQAIIAIACSISSGLLYYFAYKKHGTRLLTWTLIYPIIGWMKYLGDTIFNRPVEFQLSFSNTGMAAI